MKQSLLSILFSFFTLGAFAQITITDADINAGDNVTWSPGQEYILDGYVFVEEGATLTIEPGTIVKGKSTPTNGEATSALIIARGGKIIAEGTAEAPIIFTAEFDIIDIIPDLTKNNKGLWGGLIILGNAVVGEDGGTDNVEGIPSSEGRAQYGGTDDADDSGVLKYVSIRHAGSALEANNEINGLTLAGVGSGTEIDYIEIFANLDDGIEFFGGTVAVKHAAISFCGDDSFDYDESYRGKGQFWFSVQDDLSNRAGEWDGSESTDLLPKTEVSLSNMTFIGAGTESMNADGNDALRIRDAAAANVWSSVFVGFADRAINLDNDFAGDSYDEFLDGNINFVANAFFDFGAGSSFADIVNTDGGDDNLLITHLMENANDTQDPQLGGISREADGGLDPRLDAGSPYLSSAQVPEDPFFDQVDYIGAFSNEQDGNWMLGWTALDAYGFLGDFIVTSTFDQAAVDVTQAEINPNPATDISNLSITLEEATQIDVDIMSIDGRMIASPISMLSLEAGRHTLQIDLSSAKSGPLMLIVTGDGELIAREMIIKK